MFSGSTVTAIFYSLDQLPVRPLIIAQSRLCRSELALETPEGTVSIQRARVIVDVFREQARSYKGRGYSKEVGQTRPLVNSRQPSGS